MEFDFKHFKNGLGNIYCTVRFHPRHNMVAVTWKGTASEESIRAIKDETLDMIRKHGCLFLLNDLQDLFTHSTEILTDLIRSNWDQAVLASGVRYIVHILKPEMETPLQTDDESLAIKFFHNKLDSIEWIEQQQENVK